MERPATPSSETGVAGSSGYCTQRHVWTSKTRVALVFNGTVVRHCRPAPALQLTWRDAFAVSSSFQPTPASA